MALQHLRSSTANKRPDPTAMAEGQLALNTANASPGLFYKDATGLLIKSGPVHIGATAPNATPAAGGHAGNSVGEAWLDTSGTNPLLKIYNGASFVTVQPVASGTVVSTADTGTVTSTMILDGTILNADINASAAIVDTKLATIATGGKVSNSATTATNANTASAIVARDASGNFTAGTITAALTGAASSNVLKAGDTMTGALVVPLASAATPSLTFTGDLNTGIYSPGADQLAVATNGVGRLFVDASGNVGVNAASDLGASKLFIAGNATAGLTNIVTLRTATANSYGLQIKGNNTNDEWLIQNYYNAALAFGTSNTERLRITGGGLVGIGTSAPSAQLHVDNNSGTLLNDLVLLKGGGGSGSGNLLSVQANSGDQLFAVNALSYNVTMCSAGGSVGIGTSSPNKPLHIYSGSSDSEIRLQSNSGTEQNAYITLRNSGGKLDLYSVNGDIALNPGNNVAATFKADGKVGIGSTAPATQFAVQNASTSLGIEVDTTSGFASGPTVRGYYRAGSAYTTLSLSGSQVAFGINDVEKARLDASGRLLVGTSTALLGSSRVLQVDAPGGVAAIFKNDVAANENMNIWNAGTSGNNVFIEFGTESAYAGRGSISYNRGAGLTAYNTTSDYRAKTIFGTVENPGQTIDALKVYRGVMNGATVERPMLVAHEAKEVAPYCVTGQKDAVNKEGKPIYQQMDHQVLVPLLIAEIQQLRVRVAALENP
jgi:hypothetical protein